MNSPQSEPLSEKAGPGSPVLVVENLQKSYRTPDGNSFCAVAGVSFAIPPGECFGLLGPNGAGKSTTMSCISGFFPPTSGRALIQGIDVNVNPKGARIHLGVCAQDETLDTDFEVLDQLVLYASYFRISAAEAEPRARKLLRQFGLESKIHEPIEALSGGMRRRLQVARALISAPSILILDEPTTGLDPDARRIVWEIIRDFRARGNAVLLSTHYMDEAERLCDRIAIIHQGRLLDCAPPSELISRHIGNELIQEEIRPGVFWKRPSNLEDVYLKLTGSRLGETIE